MGRALEAAAAGGSQHVDMELAAFRSPGQDVTEDMDGEAACLTAVRTAVQDRQTNDKRASEMLGDVNRAYKRCTRANTSDTTSSIATPGTSSSTPSMPSATSSARLAIGHRAAHGYATVVATKMIPEGAVALPNPEQHFVTLPRASFDALPSQTRQRIAVHHVADCTGRYEVYLSGLDELVLADYVNFATDAESNLAEGDAEEGQPRPFVSTRRIQVGEELLLPPMPPFSESDMYDRSPPGEVAAALRRLNAASGLLPVPALFLPPRLHAADVGILEACARAKAARVACVEERRQRGLDAAPDCDRISSRDEQGCSSESDSDASDADSRTFNSVAMSPDTMALKFLVGQLNALRTLSTDAPESERTPTAATIVTDVLRQRADLSGIISTLMDNAARCTDKL